MPCDVNLGEIPKVTLFCRFCRDSFHEHFLTLFSEIRAHNVLVGTVLIVLFWLLLSLNFAFDH